MTRKTNYHGYPIEDDAPKPNPTHNYHGQPLPELHASFEIDFGACTRMKTNVTNNSPFTVGIDVSRDGKSWAPTTPEEWTLEIERLKNPFALNALKEVSYRHSVKLMRDMRYDRILDVEPSDGIRGVKMDDVSVVIDEGSDDHATISDFARALAAEEDRKIMATGKPWELPDDIKADIKRQIKVCLSAPEWRPEFANCRCSMEPLEHSSPKPPPCYSSDYKIPWSTTPTTATFDMKAAQKAYGIPEDILLGMHRSTNRATVEAAADKWAEIVKPPVDEPIFDDGLAAWEAAAFGKSLLDDVAPADYWETLKARAGLGAKPRKGALAVSVRGEGKRDWTPVRGVISLAHEIDGSIGLTTLEELQARHGADLSGKRIKCARSDGKDIEAGTLQFEVPGTGQWVVRMDRELKQGWWRQISPDATVLVTGKPPPPKPQDIVMVNGVTSATPPPAKSALPTGYATNTTTVTIQPGKSAIIRTQDGILWDITNRANHVSYNGSVGWLANIGRQEFAAVTRKRPDVHWGNVISLRFDVDHKGTLTLLDYKLKDLAASKCGNCGPTKPDKIICDGACGGCPIRNACTGGFKAKAQAPKEPPIPLVCVCESPVSFEEGCGYCAALRAKRDAEAAKYRIKD